MGVAFPGVGSLIDRLLGRTKKDPPPPPATLQLAPIAVADPATLAPGAIAGVGATVHLTAAVSANTTVTAVSTNPAALTVESVTVPVGQSSAPLLVNVLEGGVRAGRRHTRGLDPSGDDRHWRTKTSVVLRHVVLSVHHLREALDA